MVHEDVKRGSERVFEAISSYAQDKRRIARRTSTKEHEVTRRADGNLPLYEDPDTLAPEAHHKWVRPDLRETSLIA